MRLLNIRSIAHQGQIINIHYTLGPNLSGKTYVLNYRGEDITEDGETLNLLRELVPVAGLEIPDYLD